MNECIVDDGLEAGMRVIYDGNVNLAHEAPVKVVSDSGKAAVADTDAE